MAAEREIKVRLYVDTTEYDTAMKRAAKRARKLTKALRELDRVTIHISVERS